jgi:predicted kinase
MRNPKLIILVGISGSGKSTWLKSIDLTDYVVISPDDIRRELTGDVSNQTKNREVFLLVNMRIVSAINDGINVIFDATNVKSIDRKSLLSYLHETTDFPFDAYAKIFDANPEVRRE